MCSCPRFAPNYRILSIFFFNHLLFLMCSTFCVADTFIGVRIIRRANKEHQDLHYLRHLSKVHASCMVRLDWWQQQLQQWEKEEQSWTCGRREAVETVSIMLSCRATTFTVCFVSSCKSFTDGSSAAGDASFQVDGWSEWVKSVEATTRVPEARGPNI